MKIISLLCCLFLSFNLLAQQKSPVLNEKSVVKDENGNAYPYAIWKKLVQTGEYNVKINSDTLSENQAFVLYRMDEKQRAAYQKMKQERVAAMPKPRGSDFFREGDKFRFDKMTDINGIKHDFKNHTDKIVVLNFWFINCPPCKQEIPELNELVAKYKDHKEVVFIAIALDDASSLKNFLKIMPFQYHIVDDGRFYADKYGVRSYPTHVIIGKDHLIKFSTVGLAQNTIHWVDKTIKEQL